MLFCLSQIDCIIQGSCRHKEIVNKAFPGSVYTGRLPLGAAAAFFDGLFCCAVAHEDGGRLGAGGGARRLQAAGLVAD